MLHAIHALRASTRLPFRHAGLVKHKRLLTVVVVAVLLLSLFGACIVTGDTIRHRLRTLFGSHTHADEHSPNDGDVLPPDTQVDYLLRRRDGKGNTVRVMLAIVATRVSASVCHCVASAYFSDLPVVIVGYNGQYENLRKNMFVFDAARLAGLRDSDVVMMLDSDLMFSGQDMLPYIDRFIAQSAASPRELDAKAVREGRAMAPSVYSSETNCWAGNMFSGTKGGCMAAYSKLERAIEEYANTHRDSLALITQKMYEKPRYMNAGMSIHRLWSLRALNQSINNYTTHNAPDGGDTWYCDQSMVHAEYLWLRYWEMEHDAYLNKTLARTQRSPQGLWAGQLGRDVFNEMAVVELAPYIDDYELEWTNERYGIKSPMVWTDVAKRDPDIFIQKSISDRGGLSKVQLTKRNLTHTFGRSISIDLTPPTVSLTPRRKNGVDKPAVRVFPPVVHTAGYLKATRMRRALHMALWYIPMILNDGRWEKGRDYLLSMPMELWSATARVRVRYADVCPQHPFSVRPNWS